MRAVKELKFLGALINGTTEGRFLDHPSYDGLLAAAVELDVPIYIHPHLPPEPVRQAYYSGLEPGAGPRAGSRRLGLAFGDGDPRAAHGAGRHARQASEAQADHRPHGRNAAGHAGAHRRGLALDIDHLKRPISRTILDQVWITTSGIFSEPPFLAALQTFGIDRIMFSVDYPLCAQLRGPRASSTAISLAPADMAKLTHGNADALLKLKA